MGTIRRNYIRAIPRIPQQHDLDNIPYENAIKEKASTFVGREKLSEVIYDHCTAPQVKNTVMFVKGKAGVGKSAVMAHVAVKCFRDLRPVGNFVFVHSVSSCPQSNDLEQMLRRLHTNITIETGTCNRLQSSVDIKHMHLIQLERAAKEHPNKLFVILVDGVHRFDENMQAWSMWWIPKNGSPNNLRIVLSTVDDGNIVCENAGGHCPNSVSVTVKDMLMKHGEEMVTAMFRSGKVWLNTGEDNDLFGSHVRVLLSKNLSPLYLRAATEAIRKHTPCNEMSDYIRKLPSTVPELFDYLLNIWSDECGEDFIRYLVCIICISKDGLTENAITDILTYIVEKKNIQFKCSLSTICRSVRGFLTKGWGGYLSFFHSQFNNAVKMKYLSPIFEAEVHGWLFDFYIQHIKPQLSKDSSTKQPPSYYADCLQQVVHHEVSINKYGERTSSFTDTLRNIFFVRERFKHKQGQNLQEEYLTAVKYAADETTKTVLRDWQKFAKVYAPFIEISPQWSFNMAINQMQKSSVYTDVSNLRIETQKMVPYTLYWSNKPFCENDSIRLKFRIETCWRCVASTEEKNLIVVSECEHEVFIYQMDTGVLLDQIHMKHHITSLAFNHYYTELWIGDMEGFVHVYDVTTGKVVWQNNERIGEEGGVVWIQRAEQQMACCTDDDGTVAFFNETTKTMNDNWLVGAQCCAFCYSPHKQWILTGHDGEHVLKCWNMDGALMKMLHLGEQVISVSIHPTDEDVVACALYGGIWKQVSVSTGEALGESVHGTNYWCGDVAYTHDGSRMVCVSRDERTILVFDSNCRVINAIKGHSNYINNICLVPNTNQVVAAGVDGCYLFDIPATPDQQVDDDAATEGAIVSCTFLRGGEEFITLCMEGKLQKWSTRTYERTGAPACIEDVLRYSCVVVHPFDDSVIVGSKQKLIWFRTLDLSTIATFPVIGLDEGGRIDDVAVCKDGEKCVVVRQGSPSSVVVYNITDLHDINAIAMYNMGGDITSSDIHENGQLVVSAAGEGGVDLWKISTKVQERRLRKGWTSYVRFLHNPDRVLCVGYSLRVLDLEGVVLHTFHLRLTTPRSLVLLRDMYAITGNDDHSLQVHDINNGKTVYTFFNHSSEGFRCVDVNDDHCTVIAGNNNGKVYVLQTS